jgi:hypothetical protein
MRRIQEITTVKATIPQMWIVAARLFTYIALDDGARHVGEGSLCESAYAGHRLTG